MMVPFKPAEIRILVILALMALTGSALELIDRQKDSSIVSLGLLAPLDEHKYQWYGPGANAFTPLDSESQLIEMGAVPEANSANVKIDINHCGLFDLEILPGIGPALAGNIISFRDSIGGFKNIEDIDNVKGIGPAKLAMIKDRIEIK
jgi:competence protein ComEA